MENAWFPHKSSTLSSYHYLAHFSHHFVELNIRSRYMVDVNIRNQTNQCRNYANI